MNKTILQIVCIALILAFPCGKASGQYKKIPVVVITDLYHPYQDPGDNMDLIMGFGLPDVDLKAVLLHHRRIQERYRRPSHPVERPAWTERSRNYPCGTIKLYLQQKGTLWHWSVIHDEIGRRSDGVSARL